ncbi:MAG TPA: sugar ABC transporter permease [Anaerolineales bacterium]|nr:sugar ABC transporter permease [Anaerolineales bacterium]
MDRLLAQLIPSLTETVGTILFIILATVVIEIIVYVIFGRILKSRRLLVWMLVAPAAVGLAILVVYPLLWELRLSLTNMSLRRFGDKAQFFWVVCAAGEAPAGVAWLTDCVFKNFVDVFRLPVLKQVTFFPVFLRTVTWTAVNVIFHVAGGMALALLLNRPMRGRGIYRAIIILPWALPQIIAVLAWRGELHYEYGYFNIILTRLGLEPVQWLSNPTANFTAMLATNIWLGIPFMMVILLGAMQSIAGEYYEAAEIDGASSYQQWRHVTLPLIQPVLTPAIVLGTIWTFNNFNVPFLINQNELETSDILVTALFRAAFQYNRYGFAAAFAFVIFILLLAYVLIYIALTGTLKESTR